MKTTDEAEYKRNYGNWRTDWLRFLDRINAKYGDVIKKAITPEERNEMTAIRARKPVKKRTRRDMP